VTPTTMSVVCMVRRRIRIVRRQGHVVWYSVVVCAAILAAFAGLGSVASAQQSKPEEYQVKAVYLYNFGRFITWPSTAAQDESFEICIIGHDPFGAVLDATLAGESIENRKLVARRISSPGNLGTCRILFVSSSEAPRVKDVLNLADKSSVLTVSDMPGFTSHGGMIQFVLKDNKVRFEVNLSTAEKGGLTLSSQLLKVATDIRKGPLN
jgi:hypothetical protein